MSADDVRMGSDARPIGSDDRGVGEARRVLAELGLLQQAGVGVEAPAIERLGGTTNLVFRVGQGRDQCVLRIPGKGTEEYINRRHEQQAARETARVQVSPEVLHFDAVSGVMVTRYVAGAMTMTPAAFATRAGAPARAAAVLRKLHSSDAAFIFRFELFAMIDGYLKVLADKAVTLPPGYHDVVAEAGAVRAALNARALPLVACHCDPLCENFLDSGERMWLVDWEYSGMNDPLWDLGDLSVEGRFSAAQDEEMMRAYFGGEPRPGERGRVVIYKAMCDLLWTLWGLIQLANGNPAEDFRSYAFDRFGRCQDLMATPDFARHLASVRSGD